jgi:hypothetical protein
MILYPPLVGLACGEPGLLYPLPQAAKNNKAPSTSRQNLAASLYLEVFLCIFDSPFLELNELIMLKAALLFEHVLKSTYVSVCTEQLNKE